MVSCRYSNTVFVNMNLENKQLKAIKSEESGVLHYDSFVEFQDDSRTYVSFMPRHNLKLHPM